MATSVKERIILAVDTLVKYDNPTLVTTHPEKIRKELMLGKVSTTTCKVQTTPPTADVRLETVEILNGILPPKEWEENGQIWTQQVSSTPATRLDVINLQEQLDMKLQQRQARETGICPVRRELYTQCFGMFLLFQLEKNNKVVKQNISDELIRQVTINCAERGLLLLRVRDEIKMTLAAYQTLYQSSIAFGMRKALQAEQGKEDLIAIADELRQQKTELENALTELRHKFDLAEKRSAELKEAEEKKYTEEIQFLKKTNLQLKTQLEGIIAPKK
ncbi:33 kDa inner dynein arm light chain, axonemal isoform X3 [Vespa crabro]|uniref:33 kDa inner dynein arm light chain, axonemal isoform X3 n=1 Tax=Vespa crabro TaxID=7445 RepID=UPI001F02B8C2|nr:33 kDa inner dynein arm light chain, axonemal isoform X3 [Vespa crabro]